MTGELSHPVLEDSGVGWDVTHWGQQRSLICKQRWQVLEIDCESGFSQAIWESAFVLS